jgi:hypothetical protein
MKLPKLIANLDNGEGDISFPQDWKNLDSLLQMDILGDWIGILESEYKKSRKQFRNSFKDKI